MATVEQAAAQVRDAAIRAAYDELREAKELARHRYTEAVRPLADQLDADITAATMRVREQVEAAREGYRQALEAETASTGSGHGGQA